MADTIEDLLAALPPADEPEGWQSVPTLDGWSFYTSPNGRELGVKGFISGSWRFVTGDLISSSMLTAVDGEHRFVKTLNSIYRLGWPARYPVAPDADFAWPPALAVASSKDWTDAARDAVALTGEHSMTEQARAALPSLLHIDSPWPLRKTAAGLIAAELVAQERSFVADAFWVLSFDIGKAADRRSAAEFVVNSGEIAGRDRDLTTAEKVVIAGWLSLT